MIICALFHPICYDFCFIFWPFLAGFDISFFSFWVISDIFDIPGLFFKFLAIFWPFYVNFPSILASHSLSLLQFKLVFPWFQNLLHSIFGPFPKSISRIISSSIDFYLFPHFVKLCKEKRMITWTFIIYGGFLLWFFPRCVLMASELWTYPSPRGFFDLWSHQVQFPDTYQYRYCP